MASLGFSSSIVLRESWRSLGNRRWVGTMRTTGAGTITQALIDTQQDATRIPYIKIYINGVDYSARLLYLEHHEEAYRERSVIGLSNRDGTLDTLNILGKVFNIGYGYDSSGNGGSSTDKVDTAPLWVKSYQIITIAGERVYQIYAEGAWMRLREQKVITNVTGPQAGDATHDPYGKTFAASHTVYALLALIIEGAMSWDLVDTPPDDGIIDTFQPVFEVNQMPFENAAALIYRLLWMTKVYLRLEAGSPATTPRFRVIYPQDADSTDETYRSAQANWFVEYVEKPTLLIPNSIVVLCNRDVEGSWDSLIVGTAVDQPSIDAYAEIVQSYIDGSITTQANANNRAAAILARLEGEILAGRLIIPHDARVELYDKPDIIDDRTASTRTWPSDEIVRITNIIHRYNRDEQVYELELALGEVSSDFGRPQWLSRARPTIPETAKDVRAVPSAEGFEFLPKGPTEPSAEGFEFLQPSAEGFEFLKPVSPTIREEIRAGYARGVERSRRIEVAVGKVWRAVTPWREEAGETFGSEIMERFRTVSKFFGGFFGGRR